MKQPRKLLRNSSVGLTPFGPIWSPVQPWFHTCRSIRSRKNEIQPTPPSESATFSVGNRRKIPPEHEVGRDHRRQLRREHDQMVDVRRLRSLQADRTTPRCAGTWRRHCRRARRTPGPSSRPRPTPAARPRRASSGRLTAVAPLGGDRSISAAMASGHRWDDAQRDEPTPMVTGQLVDLPVVVGGDDDVGEVAVDGGARQRHPVEAGERRETHRRQHPVGVHVPHPQIHVVRSRAHLGEPHRVEIPLLVRPRRHRTQAAHARLETLEHPVPVSRHGVVDVRGSVVAVLRRDVTLEHVRGLDHVIVDADEDHVFDLHGGTSRSEADERSGSETGYPGCAAA